MTPDAAATPLMPGFGHILTDKQVAELAGYLRTRFSGQPAWDHVDEQVARIRSEQRGAAGSASGMHIAKGE